MQSNSYFDNISTINNMTLKCDTDWSHKLRDDPLDIQGGAWENGSRHNNFFVEFSRRKRFFLDLVMLI